MEELRQSDDEVGEIVENIRETTESQNQDVNDTDTPEGSQRKIRQENETNDLDLDSMCEVVVSFKCKYCHFLFEDKSALASHIRNLHLTPEASKQQTRNRIKSGSVHHSSSHQQLPEEGEIDLSIFSKIKTNKREIDKEELSSVPSTPSPDAFFIHSEEEDNNNEQQQTLQIIDPELESVFLCSECDIMFASKELCCRHMTSFHGLSIFNSFNDFIQDVDHPISRERIKSGEIITIDSSETVENESTNAVSNNISAPQIVEPPDNCANNKPKIFRTSKRACAIKNTLYPCPKPKCLIKFKKVETMKLHEKCHILELKVVENCNKRINDQQGDSPKKKEIARFTCYVCMEGAKPAKLFDKWSNCVSHLWKEHKVDAGLHSCSVCDFKNYLLSKVKYHEQLHQSKKIYDCTTCGKKFKQKHQLTTHVKYHKENGTILPPPIDSRWYTPKECSICGRILSDAKCLKNHIAAVHNKLKPYSCNICGHRSARKAELNLHIRQHSGHKPYKCNISFCQFVTGDHNSLRKHKLRHGDERPYSCPHCDYRCINSSAYKKHIIAHHPGRETGFQCTRCSYTSINESMFSSHQKDHEEGRIKERSNKDSEEDDEDDNHLGETDDSSNSMTTARENAAHASKDSHQSDCSDSEYPEIGIRKFGFGSRARKRNAPQEKSRNKSKSLQKERWLEDDSLDETTVIDTGGVTIPASPLINEIPQHADGKTFHELQPVAVLIDERNAQP